MGATSMKTPISLAPYPHRFLPTRASGGVGEAGRYPGCVRYDAPRRLDEADDRREMAACELELALHEAFDGIEVAFDDFAPARVGAHDHEFRVCGVALALDEARVAALAFVHVQDDAGVSIQSLTRVGTDDHGDGSESPSLAFITVATVCVERRPQGLRPLERRKSMQLPTPCPDLEDAPLSLRPRLTQTRRANTHTVRSFHSTLLDEHGFRHAFATRHGGVSDAPFDSLNLGSHLGDRDDAVAENRRRFARELGVADDRLFEQRQVHGVEVRAVSAASDRRRIADEEGDALITRDEGLAVAARTADCVPVLIAHPQSGDVAAVHAGWRGAVAGVVSNALRALGHPPAELLVAIGPHIRVGAFEIGEEVAEELERVGGTIAIDRASGRKPHGDLAALLRVQLGVVGVPESSIDDVGGCTHADAANFFSHRRDRGRTGRHLSAIVAKQGASC